MFLIGNILSDTFGVKIPMNTLYYGDNLKILRDYSKDESVDLVYFDPPFSSNHYYNVLSQGYRGQESIGGITVFKA